MLKINNREGKSAQFLQFKEKLIMAEIELEKIEFEVKN